MTLEKELRQELRITELRKAILRSVQAAGVISLALVAPNVLGALAKIRKYSGEKSVRSAVQRLEEKGLLLGTSEGLTVTAKGQKYLDRIQIRIPSPQKWDKKWRIVIFDIPERRKTHRDQLRSMLQSIGFLRLQNSVWIYPHDCEELIILLKVEYHIGKEVLYIIADKIENSSAIKKHFQI